MVSLVALFCHRSDQAQRNGLRARRGRYWRTFFLCTNLTCGTARDGHAASRCLPRLKIYVRHKIDCRDFVRRVGEPDKIFSSSQATSSDVRLLLIPLQNALPSQSPCASPNSQTWSVLVLRKSVLVEHQRSVHPRPGPTNMHPCYLLGCLATGASSLNASRRCR